MYSFAKKYPWSFCLSSAWRSLKIVQIAIVYLNCALFAPWQIYRTAHVLANFLQARSADNYRSIECNPRAFARACKNDLKFKGSKKWIFFNKHIFKFFEEESVATQQAISPLNKGKNLRKITCPELCGIVKISHQQTYIRWQSPLTIYFRME